MNIMVRVLTAILIATVFNTTKVECKGLEEADFNVFRFNQCPLASLRVHLLFDLTPRQCAYECAVRASCKGAGYSPGFKCCELFDVDEVNSNNSDDRRCNFIRKSDISAVEVNTLPIIKKIFPIEIILSKKIARFL
ncbi:hypothetical protein DPMN_056326 [Dreissena polymorpha]|uniref:Apple domain-containing protein n=1 Tax=Dreissena polymorpha TaxID=45954 RepID=A0A9D4CU54_DREPO|nr:hypothetical protein DPMN_056326 [Dreissena polymorpha]